MGFKSPDGDKSIRRSIFLIRLMPSRPDPTTVKLTDYSKDTPSFKKEITMLSDAR
jgi:hypothetical protein